MTEPKKQGAPAPRDEFADLLGTGVQDDARRARRRRAGKLVVALVVVGVLGYAVWQWASGLSSVQRKAPDMTAIIPLPPPPPPPPEPEPPPPEPEEPPPEELVEPEPEPEPVPAEEPQPEEAPSPADDMAQAMEMDASAQAGSDAFNIAAGSGRGMAGSGGGGRVGNATYGQYMSYALQKILREDERTRTLAYRVQVSIWLTETGQVARVELVRSSGDAGIDAKVIAALRDVPALDQRPPASLAMPVRAVLNSRRPS